MSSNFSIFAFVKKFVFIIIAALSSLAAADGVYEKYIEKYSSIAVSEMQRTGVPASITLAQGLVESAAGRSTLAVKANNHFGIKCHADWKGKKTYRDDDKADECFRVYPNAEASFRDHSDFLRYKDRYKSLFDLDPTDYKAWSRGLKKAGYATDPKYADKLIKVIEDYRLYRYDNGTVVPLEKPSVVEKPKEVQRAKVQEEYHFSLSRKVYEINGVPCIYALAGDTYETIAASNGLFEKELLRFNDVRKSRELEPGEIVFLKSKKNQGARGSEKYIVGEDNESLWSISQRFGVKMSAIKRLNKYSSDYVPGEGDTIVLRRR